MANCVNITNKDFLDLLEETKLPSILLEMRVAQYQELNGLDSFPSASDIMNPVAVTFTLKATDILLSDKAKQVFDKGEKNKWSLDKIFTELAIPKEQKQLLLDLGITDREQLAIELQSRYGYNVEVKTQTEKVPSGYRSEEEALYDQFTDPDTYQDDETGEIIYHEKTNPDWSSAKDVNTSHYSNLTSPGGTNYRELEIFTPDITPSIKGHAKFATDKGIGWFRSDDKNQSSESNKTEELLNEAINGDNKVYSELANILKNHYNLHKSVTTRIVDFLKDFFGKILNGNFGNNVIELVKNLGKDNIRIFLHESIHGITSEKLAIYRGGDLSRLTKKELDAIKELERIFEKVKKELLTLKNSRGNNIFSNSVIDSHYGFTNLDEFLAEAFTNREFQSLLSNIKGEGRKPNIFKQLINAISDLLGLTDSTILDDIFALTEEFADNNNVTNDNSKTRRILEIQSDLFQKGRDVKDLIGDTSTTKEELHQEYQITTEVKDNQILNQLNKKPIFSDNKSFGGNTYLLKNDIWYNTKAKKEYSSENKFLQLLNKDSNWVTFFIKSIIQDSIKKGYEKVLFPKGETAAKIEGHDTLESEINRINSDISEREDRIKEYSLFNENDGLYTPDGFSSYKELIVTEKVVIAAGEQRKSELKAQGIEKLKPIEAFYEIKIGNILDKQFGKDNVKTITDEYGNEWREIDLSNQKVKEQTSNILLKNPTSDIQGTVEEVYQVLKDRVDQRVATANKTNESETKWMTYKQFLATKRRLESTNGGQYFYDKYASDEIPGRGEPLYKARVYPAKDAYKKAREAAERIVANRGSILDPISTVTIVSQPETVPTNIPLSELDGQLRLFDDLMDSNNRSANPLSKAEVRTVFEVANRMTSRFNIPFKVITRTEAIAKNPKNENSMGFYSPNEHTAYLIEGFLDASTAIHEIFAHPFLIAIKSDPKLSIVYQNLLKEAKQHDDIVARIDRDYAEYSQPQRDDEYIIAAMEEAIAYEGKAFTDFASKSKFMWALHDFWKAFTNFINGMFGKEANSIESFGPNSNILDVVKYVLYGEKKMNLASSPTEVTSINEMIDILRFGKVKTYIEDLIKGGYLNEKMIRLLGINEVGVNFLLDYINHNNPSSYQELLDGILAARANKQFEPETMLNKLAGKADNSNVLMSSAKFIEIAVEDLSAQLLTLKRTDTSNVKYREKVDKLIKDLQAEDEVLAIIRYVQHALTEAKKASVSVDVLAQQLKDNEVLDENKLISLQRDFLGMYNKSLSLVNQMMKFSTVFDKLPRQEKDNLTKDLEQAEAILTKINAQYETFLLSAFNNVMFDVAGKSGSATISDAIKERFEVARDIPILAQYLGGLSYSSVEQLTVLDRIISDISAKTNMQLSQSENVLNLAKYAKNLSKGKLKLTFKDFIETDENGKRTGYLTSPLKYGVFLARLTKFQTQLAKEFGLKSIYDKPAEHKDRVLYNEKMNTFLGENAERIFKKEYYELRNGLSREATEQMEEASLKIKEFKEQFKNEKGVVDTRLMTNADTEELFTLIKDRQFLSGTHYSDGTPKTGKDLEISIEIRAFNKATSGKLQYTSKSKEFNEAFDLIKSDLKSGRITRKEFDTWVKNNTKKEYAKQFYDDLDKIEKAKQSDDWQQVYDARQAVLKLFRDDDRLQTREDRLASNKVAMAFVKRADAFLDKYRVKGDKAVVKFSDIAEIITTDEYNAEAALQKQNPATYATWYYANHFLNKKNQYQPYSYWTKLEPANKEQISTVPNSLWSELDKDSEFYNKNYDENLAENGYQPKKSLYDNSKAFEKLIANKESKEMYDALLAAMKEANSFYAYIDRPNNLRLPQIPAGVARRMSRANGMIKALKELGSEFTTQRYDVQFGAQVEDKNYNADGSKLRFPPTGYRTMLDDPNNMSDDLLGNIFLYYQKALSYKNTNEVLPKIEILMAGLKKTSVRGRRNFSLVGRVEAGSKRVAAGETRILKRASTEIDRTVYGENMSAWGIKLGNSGLELNITKPLMKMLSLARASNLSFNTFAIAANYGQAEVNLKIEAATGLYISNEDYTRATWECLKQMPETLAKSASIRDNGKVVSLCRLFNVARSNEKDFRGHTGEGLSGTVSEKILYGPYEAGDFTVKSKMLVSLLIGNKYDPTTDTFYNKSQFLMKFYPAAKDRKDGETAFKSLKGNMYDAIVFDKNGQMTYDKKYEKALSEDALLDVYRIANRLAAKLDGVLTNSDRSTMHSNAIGQLFLMHRGWLVLNVQERFHPKHWSYEHNMMTEGQYISASKDISKMVMSFFTGKLSQFNEEMQKADNINRKYNLAKTLDEIKWMVLFAAASAGVYSLMDEDDEDENSWKMFLYTFLMRCLYEQNAMYSPGDLFGILQNPTAANGWISQMLDLSGYLVGEEGSEVVGKGRYEGWERWKMAAVKASPFRHLYESILAPDLKAKVKYLTPNIGGPYQAAEAIVGGELHEKKAAKKLKTKEDLERKKERLRILNERRKAKGLAPLAD